MTRSHTAQRARAAVRPLVAAFVCALVLVGLTTAPATAATHSPAHEAELLAATNASRAANGASALAWDAEMSTVALRWSHHMAGQGKLSHNSEVGAQVNAVTNRWSTLGENVGYAGSIAAMQKAFMDSPGHRRNIVHGAFTRAGIGVVQSGATLYATVVFADGQPITTRQAPTTSTHGVGMTPLADGRLALGERRSDGRLQTRTQTSNGWTGWSDLGGGTDHDPALVSLSGSTVNGYVTGRDGALWQRTDAGWLSLGGSLKSGPAAVATGDGRLAVFATGTDDAVWSRTFDGRSWGGWHSLGGVLRGAPEVSSWGKGRIDLFGTGTDRQVWHRAFDTGRWGGWEPLGGQLVGAPGAASGAPGTVHVVGRGVDDSTWVRAWDGARWTPWQSLGGATKTAPEAVRRSGSVAVVVRGTDGALWTRSFSSGRWSGWTGLL